MIKTLIFLTFTLQLTSAATHSLQFLFTMVTPGISLPEFTAVSQVDAEQIGHYDSNNRTVVIKVDWLKKDENELHMEILSTDVANQETLSRAILAAALEAFNHTEKGLHTVQRTVGCELDDDGSKRGHDQFGYDGYDILTLDLNSGTWIAALPQALPYAETASAQDVKNFLLIACIAWLQNYVEYGKHVLERKDPPEVALFQRDSSSPVVCHATGFFPKAVMISWQKNGEDLNEDVDLRETLPNQDGTFQKRSILTVSHEELKNSDKYTCEVQHSSLEKALVLRVSDRKVLSGKSNGVSVGLIVGVMVGALVLVIIICAAVFIWKRKSSADTPVSVHFRSRVIPVSVSCISNSPTPPPSPDFAAGQHY